VSDIARFTKADSIVRKTPVIRLPRQTSHDLAHGDAYARWDEYIGLDLTDFLRHFDEQCGFSASQVKADSIAVALAALEHPPCANEGPAIQKAIVEATTHKPAGDVDRWTFAREWVGPNAAKYHLDPDKLNTLSYAYSYVYLPDVRSALERLILPPRPIYSISR
jgi:hypothetical protein